MMTTPLFADQPVEGYYRYRPHRDAPWMPAAIWYTTKPGLTAGPAGTMVAKIGSQDVFGKEAVCKYWTYLAGNKMPKDEVLECFKTGKWRSDPPPVPEVKPEAKATPPEPKPTGVEAGGPEPRPEPRKVGPGDNSKDPDTFAVMVKEGLALVIEASERLATDPAFTRAKSTLEADAVAALAHFEANPIRIKADADKCENWRLRIVAAAKALGAERERVKAPFFAITKEIDERYFEVIRAAQAKAAQLDQIGQAWVKAEDARKLKEAEAAARATMEEARAAEEKARAEQGWPEETQAPLPIIAEPVVVVERTLIGTGSRRRGAKADKAVAVITDLGAAAAYYAAQKHPELIALVQKLADKAANSRAAVPGCVMSWETQKAQPVEQPQAAE